MTSGKGWPPRLPRLLLSLFAIAAVTAVLCEGLVWCMLEHPSLTPEPLRTLCLKYHLRRDRPLVQYLPECAQWDPGVFYTLKPGACDVASREFSLHMEINSLGLRDHEFEQGPEIAALGDSEGMGWGVEQDEMYAKALERRLGKGVLNVAVASYGTARELLMLRRADLSNLDTVIIVYNANDYGENLSFVNHGGHLVISSRERWETISRESREVTAYWPGKHLYNILFFAWNEISGHAGAQMGRPGETAVPGGTPLVSILEEKPSEAEVFLDVLGFFPDLLAGRKLVVTEINERAPHNDGAFTAGVAELLDAGQGPGFLHDVVVLDLSPYFKDEHFYVMDGHMRASGHAMVAEKLAEALQ